MNLLERIANDPVLYAIRILALGILLLFLAGIAWGQTEFAVQCKDGICSMKESDLDKLQFIINALVEKITELKGKTGCT
jgi:hypothetical protein